MNGRRGAWLAVVAPALALALWALAGLALWRVVLPAGLAGDWDQALASAATALAGWLALGAAAAAWTGWQLYQRLIAAPRRLADGAQLLALDPAAPPLAEQGPQAGLAQAVNRLAATASALRADMDNMVQEASRKVARERDQLGALMAQLHQSVVVCNLDGQILLYNDRARTLFQALSDTPEVAGGADLIGLGRSIHALIDRALIDHALQTVTRHQARGQGAASARFVTARRDRLLQVVLAPVQAGGYVLLFEDVTRQLSSQSAQDKRLIALTEASRAALANMQAALDMLEFPDLQPQERDGFQRIVRDEVATLAARLDKMGADTAHDLLTRWPLQEMPGADLLEAAAAHIRARHGQPPQVQDLAPDLWLNLDSFALIEVLADLAGRLGAGDPGVLRLRLSVPGRGRAHLDLVWPQALTAGRDLTPLLAQTGAGLDPRAVAERHGGALWLEQDAAHGESFLRFLLPVAGSAPPTAAAATPASAPRPEFYDFDLFARSAPDTALDDRRLDSLSFTVFDCETTGLDPAGGDEIIQIGAVRLVNGKILQGECFDQLIDPRRPIPESSIPFHGILPQMVRGQPTIDKVLPAFHAFAADSVLVGHNVAFDMRFLQLKEPQTGLKFDQPVLDTLLLASIAQPEEPSHALEAIAARLGVSIGARHNALADAMATAQVFLRLWPLLEQRGLATLGQVRAAAARSYYARLRY
ncbi:exonuclease domain-containing protein (plasmid) [Paracoccus sp. SMMA_5_TC]|uniref:3'-5' exonuclease n=1 Tax=Paracoccus sp. SMMA_5_TC TaxID=2654280 RepID=UPI0021E162CA|nr:exonuclease domain-containing protein [Paracoccus sp. SMMA_5_TC]UXU82468.1 exonuclease domain-containing protein [Paracoccus sp. SMMA_5_TC]